MKDILEGRELEIKVLDHGFVRLVDCMPRLSDTDTGDYAIAQAARVSYGVGTKTVREDEGLIRYLLRHNHTSPFEQVSIKFHIKLPLFVLGQLIRHRTAKVNIYSGRYSEMSEDFYIPDLERIVQQSTTNKQGSGDSFSEEEQNKIYNDISSTTLDADLKYREFLKIDLSRELARIILPQSNYTEMYWKMDLHNLFHFLKLRRDSHAQYEIQVFAEAIYKLIEPIFPIACKAFEDYSMEAINVSSEEKEVISKFIKSSEEKMNEFRTQLEGSALSSREQAELLKNLGV